MTKDELSELRQWVTSREFFGRMIDIETCELGRWSAYDADPYGLLKASGELAEEMQQVGTNRYVRSPESRGWVHEGDLPLAKVKAMYERIHREYAARKQLDHSSWPEHIRRCIKDGPPVHRGR